ncbi:MAG: hypothetical protein GWM92_16080 [Gemmatimonadetes bacterium]|nr:hypothetical protein [Gemmatimonadota bacterium]NIR80258.1 hypothetical protein [Gemmatimonadota bacterium]NIT89020.1 hypothetical protein [Gemmatimonadota bacterium]NIU32811.1 hypothetical protein [Gemmatimonadota bacterium]NIU37237.1 hypothetical protein [Gemmatimonadota bacterium]
MRNSPLRLRGFTALVAVGALAALAPSLTAGAQSAGGQDAVDQTSGPVEPHPEAVEAVTRLKSPFCPGFMLEVCPSPQAAELRDTIEVLARSGMESDEIIEWVLARYGEEWRALPKTEGKGLIAWLGPPVALFLGVGVVVLVLARLLRRRDGGGQSDTSPGLSAAEERRLAKAVREFDAP